MAARIKRTKEQIAAELQLKLSKVKSDMKDEVRRAENHRAIIFGKTLQARANGGNANSKREVEEILAGLTRDQDRKAFGLDLLPKPDKPLPDAGALAAARLRADQAKAAWNIGSASADSGNLYSALVEAVVAVENLSGDLWDGMEPGFRREFGLGPRPGELLSAS